MYLTYLTLPLIMDGESSSDLLYLNDDSNDFSGSDIENEDLNSTEDEGNQMWRSGSSSRSTRSSRRKVPTSNRSPSSSIMTGPGATCREEIEDEDVKKDEDCSNSNNIKTGTGSVSLLLTLGCL